MCNLKDLFAVIEKPRSGTVMTNTIAPSVKSVSSNAAVDTYNAIAVVLFDIRFSIMSGGQVLSYY